MERRLLSIVEAAEWLGLSQSYLYRLVENGAIPHLRFGRVIRFDINELDEWLTNNPKGQIRRRVQI